MMRNMIALFLLLALAAGCSGDPDPAGVTPPPATPEASGQSKEAGPVSAPKRRQAPVRTRAISRREAARRTPAPRRRREPVRTKDTPTRVLFIGNSLTSANNLPGMLVNIARSQGRRVVQGAWVPGGARLIQHAANPAVQRKLKERPWDFVVLQEQSQYPGFSQKQIAKDVFPFAKKLAEAARKAQPGVSVVFYQAMTHRNGDPANRKAVAELATFEGAQRRVNQCYIQMAKDNRGLVAPVGEVWKAVRAKYPNLKLYGDNTHPNQTGTYLAACVFYVTLFRKPCTGSSVPRRLDSATAKSLQEMVDKLVLDPGQKRDWR